METTSRRRAVYTAQQRREYVERFERSGLSQAEFCRRARIHPVTFSQWRGRSGASAPAFAEVQLSAPYSAREPEPAPAAALTLHLSGGAKLEIGVAAEATWHGLGVLLRSLRT